MTLLPIPSSLIAITRLCWGFHWQRLCARWHRLQLAIHARGWRVGLARGWQAHAVVSPVLETPLPPVQCAAPGRQRILWMDATTPRPDRDSGSLRAFQLMRLLLADGHALDFMPDDGVDAGGYTQALRQLGAGLPARRGSWLHWLSALERSYDSIVISRYHLAQCWLEPIRTLHPGTRIILDTVDLHHLREQREAEFRHDRRLQRLAAITRRRELAAIAGADSTWVVSPEEADLLAARMPEVHCLVVPNVHEVAPIHTPFQQRQGVLFVGGAAHPPNIDAAYWLLTEIIPWVRQEIAHCPFHLVGDGLRAALPRGVVIPQDVHLHGYVPDLSELLRSCRVSIAPLRFGAGVNGKINQAMAAGLPVVATRSLRRGLRARDGEDLLLAEDAQGLAAAIVRVYRDAALWARLVHGGVDNVQRYFSADAVRRVLAQSFPLKT